MNGVQVTRTEPKDIGLNMALYEHAYQNETNLSGMLERIDPSAQYESDPLFRGTDAFQRQLYLAGISPASDPERGLWASKVGDFWTSKTREGSEFLFPEFCARAWRRVAVGGNADLVEGQRFYLSNDPVSEAMYPSFVSRQLRAKKIQPAIPLARLIAITTNITGGVYKAFYLTEPSGNEYSMARVSEGAEVPTAKLTGGDHSINVRKYGRALEGSYETFRRMQLDLFAFHLQRLAVQAEVDKVKTVIDIMLNGDGNSSTSATNYNIGTLDTDWASGDKPSIRGYLAWRMKFTNPYLCDVLLAQESDCLDVLLMNAGSGNVTFGQMAGLFGIGGLKPIGPQLGPTEIGWESSVTAHKLIGTDTRFAVEQVVEAGTSLVETDKLVKSQFNVIVITEMLGYCILDQNATKTLTLNT